MSQDLTLVRLYYVKFVDSTGYAQYIYTIYTK